MADDKKKIKRPDEIDPAQGENAADFPAPSANSKMNLNEPVEKGIAKHSADETHGPGLVNPVNDPAPDILKAPKPTEAAEDEFVGQDAPLDEIPAAGSATATSARKKAEEKANEPVREKKTV